MQQVIGDDRQRDAAQVEALAAADDRGQYFVCLGRGKDELHVRRRLFQRLQKRIKRCGGKHVDLIDVVDLVAATRRGVFHALPQVADLVHAVVACAVDLQHIQAVALGDLFADRVIVIKLHAGSIGAVQRHGKDARGGRLSRATRPDEKISMSQPILRDGIP